jgi:DNA-binding CsgD family transcriptional regulator
VFVSVPDVEPRSYGAARLLELVGQVVGLLEIDEFRGGTLTAVLEAVPSKWASLNELSDDRVIAAIAEPHIDAHWFERFGELAHENPIYRYHRTTGDGRATRFSDVATRAELEATRLFREVYVPLGVMHQIAFTLPSDAGRVLAIALSREDRDFTNTERRFLNRARPYLIQAYRNALDYTALKVGLDARLRAALERAGLTAREAEVMALVARGASSEHAADQLGLSQRTIDKHLENTYRKLNVTTRSAAAQRAWQLTT